MGGLANKKAQIPSTLEMMVAIFIVLFIIILLILSALAVAGNEKIKFWKSGNKIAKEGMHSKTDLVITEGLIAFLNTRVENGETVYDLVSKADFADGRKEREDIFKKETKKFIDKNLPIDNENYFRVWVRVYKANEEVGQYYSTSLSQNYGVEEFLKGGKGGINCDPSQEIGTVLTTIFIIPDKKIVVCGNSNV